MPVEKHPVFEPPKNLQTPIWRYMDFTKFVSILENKGLFFSRADKLGDHFEGSYSKGNQVLRPAVYQDKMPPEALKTMSEFSRWVRQWTMINCWHMNEHESAGMWKLYAQTNEAIAIKSIYNKLHDVLDETCFLGVVKYINYETDWLPEGNSLYPYVHKRLSFAHEQEVRAVHAKFPTNDKGIDYSVQPPSNGVLKAVDLSDLIDSIYVAPTSPAWYRELVEKVVRQYKLNKPVIQSVLDSEPFF